MQVRSHWLHGGAHQGRLPRRTLRPGHRSSRSLRATSRVQLAASDSCAARRIRRDARAISPHVTARSNHQRWRGRWYAVLCTAGAAYRGWERTALWFCETNLRPRGLAAAAQGLEGGSILAEPCPDSPTELRQLSSDNSDRLRQLSSDRLRQDFDSCRPLWDSVHPRPMS